MKKTVFALLITLFSVHTYAQKGDLFVGATGGYITSYKNAVFGLNASYHLSDPLEISFTGLMNPEVKYDDDINGEAKIKLYSANIDFNYYILLQRTWAMGPTIGGQYMYADKTYLENVSIVGDEYSNNAFGFNIGWRMRFNITENIKLNGGWRYTSASENASHHLFYLGLGYTFNLN